MSMIKIENLTFSYPTSYDNVFENVSFQVDTDWKLGFVGRNGRGKTTFLNLLLGKYEYSGKILSSVQFDYFPYPVSDKNRITEDILQEICPLAEEWELMRELSYLDVDVDVLWRPFETLSNGEQTKVLIAALFLNEGHFLLIDEPTNHLDAKARKSVAAYLKKKKGFILVSHDRRFLDDCVDYMEPLKPRDKVTQHMTRDGLTLDNQTTGESVNVSSREAEQEYTAQPEGAAEKILERADELHDRHKAKKAAKDAGETVAQATGPVSRLQFTAEERASPELAPYIKKAEKRADQLEAAKEALPKKRVVTKETGYDEAKGKAKSRLYFDKVEKSPPQLKPNPASRPIQEAGLYLHGKIHEVEHENVGVEGGHKGEELAERQAGRMIRSGVHRHKLKPYRAAAKAERKSIAANAEFAYQKSLRDNPELAQATKNPVSRFWQKQHIKREYAKAARAAGQTAQGAASTAKTTAAAAKKAAEKSRQAASFAARHWKGALIVGGVGLMLLLVMGGLQSCTAMFGSTGTGLAATSYLSEDSDMLGAEAAYGALEADLQHELDNYESLHPGYDEYRFDLDEIKHDPYVLTSILSALHNGVFTLGEVQGDLAMLFEKQYILTQTIETETRYRTETRTDSEGNTYTVEVPYTYYICNVKLENFDLSHLPIYILTEEQMGFYAAYMQTLGNRPDLFPNGSYPHASTPKEPTYYEIPPEALKDEAFAAMIAEAEKYVGYPYVWGGSSPSTSFDCSGFISWVINHSGWNVGRQTAQGLYNICTPVSPEQAKPGDLVFFVGTYDTAGMSHVGLYVGNSVMLHCGDPISYTNLNSSYWQQHFYCYGRLP